MTFRWVRQVWPRFGVRWGLFDEAGREIGCCFYLPGSRRYRVSATAATKGGAVLFDHYAGTAAAARRRLEREWDKRSIGLFGIDEIQFEEVA